MVLLDTVTQVATPLPVSPNSARSVVATDDRKFAWVAGSPWLVPVRVADGRSLAFTESGPITDEGVVESAASTAGRTPFAAVRA